MMTKTLNKTRAMRLLRGSVTEDLAGTAVLLYPKNKPINNDHDDSEMIARLSDLIEGLDQSRMLKKTADECRREWGEGSKRK